MGKEGVRRGSEVGKERGRGERKEGLHRSEGVRGGDNTARVDNCLFLHNRSDMYIAAGEYAKAVEIMGENGWMDR